MNRCLINITFLLEVYCFLCLINFVLIVLLLCDLVLLCTYVSGFGFNMTMVELIESVLNHKLVFIMETLLYMYVWSCGDLFWYTFDSEIFINWTNQLKWYSLSSWFECQHLQIQNIFIFLYLYSPQQRMSTTSKSSKCVGYSTNIQDTLKSPTWVLYCL